MCSGRGNRYPACRSAGSRRTCCRGAWGSSLAPASVHHGEEHHEPQGHGAHSLHDVAHGHEPSGSDTRFAALARMLASSFSARSLSIATLMGSPPSPPTWTLLPYLRGSQQARSFSRVSTRSFDRWASSPGLSSSSAMVAHWSAMASNPMSLARATRCAKSSCFRRHASIVSRDGIPGCRQKSRRVLPSESHAQSGSTMSAGTMPGKLARPPLASRGSVQNPYRCPNSLHVGPP